MKLKISRWQVMKENLRQKYNYLSSDMWHVWMKQLITDLTFVELIVIVLKLILLFLDK